MPLFYNHLLPMVLFASTMIESSEVQANLRSLSSWEVTRLRTNTLGVLRVITPIGSGRDTVVVLAQQLESPFQKFAVKFRKNIAQHEIEREVEVLTALDGQEGFPKLIDFDFQRGFLVMELLTDFKLVSIHNIASLPIPIEHIMIQIIDRLSAVHALGFVQVDIHARNILIDGTGKVALVDFALATQNKVYVVNEYLGSFGEVSRLEIIRPVDDIQRLVYVLINQFYKKLPWLNHIALLRKTREKPTFRVSLLGNLISLRIGLARDDSFFTGIPPGFQQVLKYVSDFKRDDNVDYAYLKSLFGYAAAGEAVVLPQSLPVEGKEGSSRDGPSELPIGGSRIF